MDIEMSFRPGTETSDYLVFCLFVCCCFFVRLFIRSFVCLFVLQDFSLVFFQL